MEYFLQKSTERAIALVKSSQLYRYHRSTSGICIMACIRYYLLKLDEYSPLLLSISHVAAENWSS